MRKLRHITLLFLLLLLTCSEALAVPAQETFPWRVRTTTRLNVRSAPSTSATRLTTLATGTSLTATGYGDASGQWLYVKHTNGTGYVSSRYVTFEEQLQPVAQTGKKKHNSKSFGETLWSITRGMLVVSAWVLVICALLGLSEVSGIAFLFQIFCGVGAIVGGLFFDSAKGGAVVGALAAVAAALYFLFSLLGGSLSGLGSIGHGIYNVYRLISAPAYITNLLQRFVHKPWFPFIKKPHHNTDQAQKTVRQISQWAQVPFYLLAAPLRLVNAVYYNLIIHLSFEFFNYDLEVLAPSSRKEGRKNVGRWLIMLPWRILKYPIAHGFLTVVESLLFTAADCVIPTLTMYHGTDTCGSDAITADPKRNDYRLKVSNWHSGNFKTGGGNWGGDGIYFASRRRTASIYADECGAIIVCRVSLGRVVNLSQAPLNVYNNAGRYGNDHSAITRWALDKEGYTTVEWWNQWAGYWEYCMLDWRNRYNHPWRIRPLYVVKVSSGFPQRIRGGMVHWLFRKEVLEEIFG